MNDADLERSFRIKIRDTNNADLNFLVSDLNRKILEDDYYVPSLRHMDILHLSWVVDEIELRADVDKMVAI